MIPDDEYRQSVRDERAFSAGGALMLAVAMIVLFLLGRTILAGFFGLAALACLRIASKAREEIESWR